jgi:hypothetical protein
MENGAAMRIWLIASIVWCLCITIALDPFDVVEPLAEAAAADRPPGPADFYAPPEEARARAVAWQAREASLWLKEREAAGLRAYGVVAAAPPVAALLILYMIGLGGAAKRTERAVARRVTHEERVRNYGLEVRRIRKTIVEPRSRSGWGDRS